MKATEYTVIKLPLCEASIDYARNYCDFYEGAEYTAGPESVTIVHVKDIDPTESIFWPGNGIGA